jgi:P27 family predicted phage terminase small subunit
MNEREPKPRAVLDLKPPAVLDGDAEGLRIWGWAVEQLSAMKILTVADESALTNFSVAWSRWVEAEQFIRKHGSAYAIRDDAGEIRAMVQFPQVSIARNLLSIIRGYQQEFGLTPSSRSRIVAGFGANDDEEEAFAKRILG